MTVWSSLRPILAIVAIAVSGSACGNGAPSAGSIAVSAAAGGTASPPGAASTMATAIAPPSKPPGVAAPPAATLAADGGDPVPGQLGSYTWGDGGSDSPWLPGAPIAAGSGEPLTLAVDGGVAIAGWTARRVPVGTTDGAGAVALGSGEPPITFTAPASGTWSVQVSVRFADGLGSATWYWQLAIQ